MSELDDPLEPEPDLGGLGFVLLASVVLATAFKWVSDVTAGADHGGRYDVPVVNGIAWLAFVIFTAAALLVTVAIGVRFLGWLRHLGGRQPS